MPTHAAARAETEREAPDVARFVRFVHSGKPGANSYVVLLGLQQYESSKLLKAVERGLEVESFSRLHANGALTQAQLLDVVQIPHRTLTRRRKEGRLRPDESDRLL